MMNDIDRAEQRGYLAGLFDAKGHVYITKALHRRQTRYRLVTRFVCPNPKAAEKLKAFFTVGAVHKSKKSSYLELNATHSERFFQLIYPLLKEKKREAEIAVDFAKAQKFPASCETLRNKLSQIRKPEGAIE